MRETPGGEMRRICKVEGCNRKHDAKGYCSTHYMQIKRSGKIKHIRTAPNEIEVIGDIAYITIYDRSHEPLPEKVLIDAEDVEKIKERRIASTGLKAKRRIGINYNGKHIRLYRFLMNPPPGMFVDHINHNQYDNRKANLRICTPRENNFNRITQGIHYAQKSNKWCAQIKKDGKCYCLGEFKSKKDALKTRIDAEKMLFGEFALIRT